jgi:hypothetical protein
VHAGLLALALLLSGCAATNLVKPGPAEVARGIAVDTPVEWARFHAGASGIEWWTRDGLLLNRLQFGAGIEAGQHVFTRRKAPRKQPEGPYFQPGMDANAVQQLIVDAWRAQGFVDPVADGLRPARFGNADGLRFEARMASSDGLVYRASVLAAESGRRLYYIIYLAPGEHYYERDLGNAERIFGTATIGR